MRVDNKFMLREYNCVTNLPLCHLLFQLFSNDLSLRYKNITVEPYGVITVDEGVPEAMSTTGRRVTWWNDIFVM